MWRRGGARQRASAATTVRQYASRAHERHDDACHEACHMPCRPVTSRHARRLACAFSRCTRTSGEAGMSLAPSSAARVAVRNARRAARRLHGTVPRVLVKDTWSAIAAQAARWNDTLCVYLSLPSQVRLHPRCTTDGLWSALGTSSLQPPLRQAHGRFEAARDHGRARAYYVLTRLALCPRAVGSTRLCSRFELCQGVPRLSTRC